MCFRPAAVSTDKTCPQCGRKCAPEDTVCPDCNAELPESALPLPNVGAPGAPAAPGVPGAPAAPGAPGAPAAPGAPKAPGAN